MLHAPFLFYHLVHLCQPFFIYYHAQFDALFQRAALIVNLSFHKRFLLTARFQDFYSAYFTRFQDFCLHMLFLRHDDRFFSTVENVFLADQIDQASFSHFFEHFRLHARQIHLGAVPFQFFYKIDHSLDA